MNIRKEICQDIKHLLCTGSPSVMTTLMSDSDLQDSETARGDRPSVEEKTRTPCPTPMDNGSTLTDMKDSSMTMVAGGTCHAGKDPKTAGPPTFLDRRGQI